MTDRDALRQRIEERLAGAKRAAEQHLPPPLMAQIIAACEADLRVLDRHRALDDEESDVSPWCIWDGCLWGKHGCPDYADLAARHGGDT